MILEELEQAFRDRNQGANGRMVILAIQIDERDVRALVPQLQAKGISLSERVRDLIRNNTRHQPEQKAPQTT